MIGDLGSRLEPVRRSIRKVWTPADSGSGVVFDNGIIGSGCIRISRKPAAPIDQRVVVFGDSFARQLTGVMADIFREVTWVNCPATMPIIEVVERSRPDIVLTQTNARYLKTCPKLAETIKYSVLSKLDRSQMPSDWFSS